MASDQQKRAAALYAADLVEHGMVIGLGSGSTAEKLVAELGRRYQEGLRFQGVATSKRTAEVAEAWGIPLLPLDGLNPLDLAIDGADEVDPGLNLIKGGGGQFVHERLVADAARLLIVVVDSGKLVMNLGERSPIPVEVLPFGWTTTRNRLEQAGLDCEIRGGNQNFVTANHNFILDCTLRERPASLKDLALAIKQQTGVVDHGLFLGMSSVVIVGADEGAVTVLKRDLPPANETD